MGHSTPVSTAIMAALDDINLLRSLVDAPNKQAANDVLVRYRADELRLGLSEPYLEEFWDSLKHGVMTMDARTLVDYFYTLRPDPAARTVRGRPQEWTP